MPLSGLLVVEFAGVLAGPSVGMFLAEVGARVIKVENPQTGGDVTRGWTLGTSSAPGSDGAPSPYFASVNWGKESVALDFARADHLEAAQRLAERAEVVLVSYKAGDAARYGLDYEAVAATNPRAVYAEITAYGPGDDRLGYDAVIQGETGFMHLNGTPESGPIKLPVALMDILAGHQLKEAVLVALLERERTGRGSRVSVSLLQSGLAALINQASNWLVAGVNPQRLGSGHPNIVPYGTAYVTRDGREAILAVGTDRQFSALCDVLGLEELATDTRFASNPARVTHREELEAILKDAVGRWDRDELLSRLAAAGVPAGPIFDVREALEQRGAAPMVLEGGGLRGVRSVAFEPSASYRPRALSAPPALGRDTERVLRGMD